MDSMEKLQRTWKEQHYRQMDPGVRGLVIRLNDAGIETDWSCQGGRGHLCSRMTIQCRTWHPMGHAGLAKDKQTIETVMRDFGITDYWLSLVCHHGNLDTHGGEPTWLIQVPAGDEMIAIPISYQGKDRL